MKDFLYDIFFSPEAIEAETILMKIGIAILILAVFVVFSFIIKKNSLKFVEKVFKIKNESFEKAFSASLARPVSAFLIFWGIHLSLFYLPLNASITVWAYPILSKLFKIAIILTVSVILQNYIENITVFVKVLTESKNQTIIGFFTKVLKAVVIVFTIVIILKEFGYDVNGLIAGIGLGGLTFALAAQDTASNFFSGVVILLDKPFVVGDWIAVGSIEGVVEKLNFRSCRIRTFDNALIAVPNSKLSSDSVTNWTQMNLRKTKFVIGLVYSTPKDTLQKICTEIKETLSGYSEVKTETILVWFDCFNSSSLDVTIQFHSFPIPLAEHTLLKEKINYMIMDTIAKNNTHFAYNTTTVITQNS